MRRGGDSRMRGMRILHEDDQVIVVDKAAGLLAQSLRGGEARSVEGELSAYVRKGQWKSTRRVYLVHRLDRETSGVMVVAKTEAVQEWFRSRWNEITKKVYLARVEGVMESDGGVYESYLVEDDNYYVRSVKDGSSGGRLARTEWRTVECGRGKARQRTSLVEIDLRSGRKNQIRVHFAEAGHPVVGDMKYGSRAAKPVSRERAKREHGERRAQARRPVLCLHAWKLEFVHPATGRTLSFEAPPPPWAAIESGGRREGGEG